MNSLIKSIKNSIQTKNWYSALVVALILPDICAKLEGGNKISSVRYPEWFNTYLGNEYEGFLSGNDCYALRCALLHEGTSDIERQKAKEALDKFVFISDGSHKVKINDSHLGDQRYDGKSFLVLSTKKFCEDMVNAVTKWRNDDKVKKDFSNMLKIHENGVTLGGIFLE